MKNEIRTQSFPSLSPFDLAIQKVKVAGIFVRGSFCDAKTHIANDNLNMVHFVLQCATRIIDWFH